LSPAIRVDKDAMLSYLYILKFWRLGVISCLFHTHESPQEKITFIFIS